MHRYPMKTRTIDEVTYQPNCDEVITLALVVRDRYSLDVGERAWLVDDGRSLQAGYMHLPAGHIIEAHKYQRVGRVVRDVTMVLLVRKGKLRVVFYGLDDHPATERWLERGDLLVHLCGGHEIHVAEAAELFEFKTGPYLGAHLDKTRLAPSGGGGQSSSGGDGNGG